jgi:hypothetical protein
MYSSYLGLADRRYRSMVHDKQADMTLYPFTPVTHPLILHFSASHYQILITRKSLRNAHIPRTKFSLLVLSSTPQWPCFVLLRDFSAAFSLRFWVNVNPRCINHPVGSMNRNGAPNRSNVHWFPRQDDASDRSISVASSCRRRQKSAILTSFLGSRPRRRTRGGFLLPSQDVEPLEAAPEYRMLSHGDGGLGVLGGGRMYSMVASPGHRRELTGLEGAGRVKCVAVAARTLSPRLLRANWQNSCESRRAPIRQPHDTKNPDTVIVQVGNKQVGKGDSTGF